MSSSSGLSCRLHPGPRGKYLLMCMCVCVFSVWVRFWNVSSRAHLRAPGTQQRRPWVTVSSLLARAARACLLPRHPRRSGSPWPAELDLQPALALLTPRLLPCALTQRAPGPAPGGPCLGRVGCPAALPLKGSAGRPAPTRPAAESGLPAAPSAPTPCRPGDGEEGCTSGPHPARPPPPALSWRPALCRASSPSPTSSSAEHRWRSTTRY